MKASSNHLTTLAKTIGSSSLLAAILNRLSPRGCSTEEVTRSGASHRSDSTELRVWTECDRHGQVVWSAYDPRTNRSVCHLSEDQMRAWVEQRNRY